MPFVYILHSQKLDKYYIGFTVNDPEIRLDQHNSRHFDTSFTVRGIPWKLIFSIKCESEKQARQIESHVKKMKSKKFVENLIKYPDLCNELIRRFS